MINRQYKAIALENTTLVILEDFSEESTIAKNKIKMRENAYSKYFLWKVFELDTETAAQQSFHLKSQKIKRGFIILKSKLNAFIFIILII